MNTTATPSTVESDGRDLGAIASVRATANGGWSHPDPPARAIAWSWAALPAGIDPRRITFVPAPVGTRP